MSDDESRPPRLALRVVYEDLPDLIQVEARFVADEWSGITWAYTSPASLAEEARGLVEWTGRLREEFVLNAGSETGTGWLSLRWYAIDRAGHLACHVRFTATVGRRPESVRLLSYEFDKEPALVERCARQLITLAESLRGEAILTGA